MHTSDIEQEETDSHRHFVISAEDIAEEEEIAVELYPPVISIGCSLSIAVPHKRRFTLANHGNRAVCFRWREQPNSDEANEGTPQTQHGHIPHTFQYDIEPPNGIVPPNDNALFELTFSVETSGALETVLLCDVTVADTETSPATHEPIALVLQATMAGPVLRLDAPAVDFGIVPVGHEVSTSIQVTNTSDTKAHWSFHSPSVEQALSLHRRYQSQNPNTDFEFVPEFIFIPDNGILRPQQSVMVSIFYKPQAPATLREIIECRVSEGDTQYLSLRAEAQQPRVCISNPIIELNEISIDVPIEVSVTMKNLSFVEVPFEWSEIDNEFARTSVTPQCGVISAGAELPVTLHLIGNQASPWQSSNEYEELILPCQTVSRQEPPIGLLIRFRVKPLTISMDVLPLTERLASTPSTTRPTTPRVDSISKKRLPRTPISTTMQRAANMLRTFDSEELEQNKRAETRRFMRYVVDNMVRGAMGEQLDPYFLPEMNFGEVRLGEPKTLCLVITNLTATLTFFAVRFEHHSAPLLHSRRKKETAVSFNSSKNDTAELHDPIISYTPLHETRPDSSFKSKQRRNRSLLSHPVKRSMSASGATISNRPLLLSAANETIGFQSRKGTEYVVSKMAEREQISFENEILRDALGVVFDTNILNGRLDGNRTVTIFATCYSNSPGVYEDTLSIKIDGIEDEFRIPVKATVVGCPITVLDNTIGLRILYPETSDTKNQTNGGGSSKRDTNHNTWSEQQNATGDDTLSVPPLKLPANRNKSTAEESNDTESSVTQTAQETDDQREKTNENHVETVANERTTGDVSDDSAAVVESYRATLRVRKRERERMLRANGSDAVLVFPPTVTSVASQKKIVKLKNTTPQDVEVRWKLIDPQRQIRLSFDIEDHSLSNIHNEDSSHSNSESKPMETAVATETIRLNLMEAEKPLMSDAPNSHTCFTVDQPIKVIKGNSIESFELSFYSEVEYSDFELIANIECQPVTLPDITEAERRRYVSDINPIGQSDGEQQTVDEQVHAKRLEVHQKLFRAYKMDMKASSVNPKLQTDCKKIKILCNGKSLYDSSHVNNSQQRRHSNNEHTSSLFKGRVRLTNEQTAPITFLLTTSPLQHFSILSVNHNKEDEEHKIPQPTMGIRTNSFIGSGGRMDSLQNRKPALQQRSTLVRKTAEMKSSNRNRLMNSKAHEPTDCECEHQRNQPLQPLPGKHIYQLQSRESVEVIVGCFPDLERILSPEFSESPLGMESQENGSRTRSESALLRTRFELSGELCISFANNTTQVLPIQAEVHFPYVVCESETVDFGEAHKPSTLQLTLANHSAVRAVWSIQHSPSSKPLSVLSKLRKQLTTPVITSPHSQQSESTTAQAEEAALPVDDPSVFRFEPASGSIEAASVTVVRQSITVSFNPKTNREYECRFAVQVETGKWSFVTLRGKGTFQEFTDATRQIATELQFLPN